MYDESVLGELKHLWHIILGLNKTRIWERGNSIWNYQWHNHHFWWCYWSFVKLAYKALEVGTLYENKYTDNHGKYLAKQRQGNLLGNILKRREGVLSLKTIPLETRQTMIRMLSQKRRKEITNNFSMVMLQSIIINIWFWMIEKLILSKLVF